MENWGANRVNYGELEKKIIPTTFYCDRRSAAEGGKNVSNTTTNVFDASSIIEWLTEMLGRVEPRII